MLSCKIKLANKTWVSLAENCMSISWNDLTCFKLVSNVSLDVVSGPVFTILLFEFEQKVKAFLVSKTMQGSS